VNDALELALQDRREDEAHLNRRNRRRGSTLAQEDLRADLRGRKWT
jgi:hypothetical protein